MVGPEAAPLALCRRGPRPAMRCVPSQLVQVGNGIELDAVGLQFEPYRWRPGGVTWDSSRTVVVIKLRRTSTLTVTVTAGNIKAFDRHSFTNHDCSGTVFQATPQGSRSVNAFGGFVLASQGFQFYVICKLGFPYSFDS